MIFEKSLNKISKRGKSYCIKSAEETTLKTTITFMLTLLLSSILLAALPVRGEEEIYRDVIRLHVLAASDSAEDQSKKLAVRDAVLSEYGTELASADSRAAAEAMLDEKMLKQIRETAESVLDGESVSVCFSIESYPTRIYGDFSLPAGEYLSLRILIGEGEGQNWWCVLYPPLCTAGAIKDVGYGLSDAEYDLITADTKDYRIKFKVLELLGLVFR